MESQSSRRNSRVSPAEITIEKTKGISWLEDEIASYQRERRDSKRLRVDGRAEDRLNISEDDDEIEDRVYVPQTRKLSFAMYPLTEMSDSESDDDADDEDDDSDAKKNSKKDDKGEKNNNVKDGQNSMNETTIIGKAAKNNEKWKRWCSSRVPWIILLTSAIQIWLYILDSDDMFRLLVYSPARKYEVWRFLSYSFLHKDLIHLIPNIIIQLLVAYPLEMEQTHWKVFLVYYGGVLAGALGTSIFEPVLLMVGSSAGVYSLLMSHIPHTALNFKALSHRYFRLLAVILMCVSDVIFSVMHFLTSGNNGPTIGVAAHCTGAITGILLGLTFYSAPMGESRWHKVAKYLSASLFLCWIIVAIIFNIFFLDNSKQ